MIKDKDICFNFWLQDLNKNVHMKVLRYNVCTDLSSVCNFAYVEN